MTDTFISTLEKKNSVRFSRSPRRETENKGFCFICPAPPPQKTKTILRGKQNVYAWLRSRSKQQQEAESCQGTYPVAMICVVCGILCIPHTHGGECSSCQLYNRIQSVVCSFERLSPIPGFRSDVIFSLTQSKLAQYNGPVQLEPTFLKPKKHLSTAQCKIACISRRTAQL